MGTGRPSSASQDELLAVALPFLDAGLRAGDLVALTCPPETVELICRELGERAHAGGVRSADEPARRRAPPMR